MDQFHKRLGSAGGNINQNQPQKDFQQQMNFYKK